VQPQEVIKRIKIRIGQESTVRATAVRDEFSRITHQPGSFVSQQFQEAVELTSGVN
jgi:hypothetical protein